MKFISGIYTKTANPNGTLDINIPHYHRAPIGLLNGTIVHCVYRSYPSLNGEIVKEIILTTLDQSRWHLYRENTIISNEGPGIIYGITHALKELRINVHLQEALTTEYDKTHSLTLIVDLHDFIQFVMNGSCETEVSKKVITALEIKLLSLTNGANNLIISSPSNLTISKLGFLANNSSISQNTKDGIIYYTQFNKL